MKTLLYLVPLFFCFSVSSAALCSEIEFCTTLRNRFSTNMYDVDFNTIHIDDLGIVKFEVVDKLGYPNLEVDIFTHVDGTIRVKVKEPGSGRYELVDILDKEPDLAGISSVDTTATEMTVVTDEGSTLVVTFSPFQIDFYRGEVLEVSFYGSRIYIDRSENSSAFGFELAFPNSDVLYGLHEHPTHLPLRVTVEEEPYRMFNLDNPNYPINNTASVYGAVPFIYGHSAEATSGVFFHNAAQQFVDIWPNFVHYMVEAGTLDLFVLLGPTPGDVVRQYLILTGVPFMPPVWSLGYHQCHYSYYTQEEVKEVVANFDNVDIQIDSIWLDLDFSDGRKYFAWNPENYSDPMEMQRNISATNRKMVTINDPHIKVETGYSVYDGALENGLFVRNPDGSVFEGDCWPGQSSYIDFLNPEGRAYYGNQFSYDKFPSTTPTIAGFWNDMNEPIVFDAPEGVMPGDCLHIGGVKHKELHNAYGMLQTKATHEGLLYRDNRTTRPFVLSRSQFAGSQRYTAVWNGDSTSTWEYLKISFPMCLNANLMGISFCGADVAGFNSKPTDELYQRWYQAGAWLPFYRSHSNVDVERREPFLYPEEIQKVVRNAIQLRYKHLPVWYTLFHEYIVYKSPMIRPLFFHYPSDELVFHTDDQFLVGRDILVKPVTEPGVSSVPVYFPGGEEEFWISLDTFDVHQGSAVYVEVPTDINSIPIYYRAGSVIVRKETVRPTTTEMRYDGYTLYINLDMDNTAHGTVYLDDTTTFNYLDYVEYNYLRIHYEGGQVAFEKIDAHANSGQFDFVVDLVVTHQIAEMPKGGKPGKYVQTKYVPGNSTKNIRFSGAADKVTLKLH